MIRCAVGWYLALEEVEHSVIITIFSKLARCHCSNSPWFRSFWTTWAGSAIRLLFAVRRARRATPRSTCRAPCPSLVIRTRLLQSLSPRYDCTASLKLFVCMDYWRYLPLLCAIGFCPPGRCIRSSSPAHINNKLDHYLSGTVPTRFSVCTTYNTSWPGAMSTGYLKWWGI